MIYRRMHVCTTENIIQLAEWGIINQSTAHMKKFICCTMTG